MVVILVISSLQCCCSEGLQGRFEIKLASGIVLGVLAVVLQLYLSSKESQVSI